MSGAEQVSTAGLAALADGLRRFAARMEAKKLSMERMAAAFGCELEAEVIEFELQPEIAPYFHHTPVSMDRQNF